MEMISENKAFGGQQRRYRHNSEALGVPMTFSVFLPPQSETAAVPVMYWLSGLTCTDENFVQKAGAQRLAAELGMAIVCPDTSPRGTDLPGEHDSYDFGSGAGFYVNALREPWSQYYRMYDYVTVELPDLVQRHFPVNGLCSISGHSMGGHGALVAALRNPGQYRAVSAFAPICNPSACPWGKKAFEGYLGEDQSEWAQYDASLLIADAPERLPILVDQGSADNFLEEQLLPDRLVNACNKVGHPIELRMQSGYDHSYFFIATFIDDHLRHHARAMEL